MNQTGLALLIIGSAVIVTILIVGLVRRSTRSLRDSTRNSTDSEVGVEPETSMIAAAEQLNRDARELARVGRYDEAERLYTRVVELVENALGTNHPDVAGALSNLAGVLYRQKRFEECEALHRRALEIREKALGENHPHVARSLNNLALLYKAWGRFTEVEPLYQRALQILQGSIGPNHPETVNVLSNLQVFQREQAARRTRRTKSAAQ